MTWTIPEIFWIASYFLYFWGSVSFGYLILRFSVPDIRSASRQARLGLSGITGMAMFGLSFVISIIIGREYLLVSIPLIALLAVGMLETKNLLMAGATVKVAVPVATVTERPHPRAVRVPHRAPLPAKGAKKPGAKAENMERPHFDVVLEKPAPLPKIGPGEVKPEQEKKVVSDRRRRYQERRRHEREAPAAPMPGIVTPEKVKEVRGRARQRYLEHRGMMIEQVKTDLTRPREPAEAGAVAAALGDLGTGLDLSDINKVSSLDELRELANVETPEQISINSLAGLAEIEDLPKKKGMGCPHCHSTKSSIVYCPYCGKGFCSDCSGKVGGKEEMNFFECPSCGKEVIVKKQVKKEEKT